MCRECGIHRRVERRPEQSEHALLGPATGDVVRGMRLSAGAKEPLRTARACKVRKTFVEDRLPRCVVRRVHQFVDDRVRQFQRVQRERRGQQGIVEIPERAEGRRGPKHGVVSVGVHLLRLTPSLLEVEETLVRHVAHHREPPGAKRQGVAVRGTQDQHERVAIEPRKGGELLLRRQAKRINGEAARIQHELQLCPQRRIRRRVGDDARYRLPARENPAFFVRCARQIPSNRHQCQEGDREHDETKYNLAQPAQRALTCHAITD